MRMSFRLVGAILLAAGAAWSAADGLTNVSAASYVGPAGAPGSLMVAFGANLSADGTGSSTPGVVQRIAGTSGDAA